MHLWDRVHGSLAGTPVKPLRDGNAAKLYGFRYRNGGLKGRVRITEL